MKLPEKTLGKIPPFQILLFIIITVFFVLATSEAVRRNSFDIRQRALVYNLPIPTPSPSPSPTPTPSPVSKVITCPSTCTNGCKVASNGNYECLPVIDSKIEPQEEPTETCDISKCINGCEYPTVEGGKCINPPLKETPDEPEEIVEIIKAIPLDPEEELAQVSTQTGIDITYSGSLQARQADALSEFARLIPPELQVNTKAIRIYDTYGINTGDKAVSSLNRDGIIHVANTVNSLDALIHQSGLNNQETRISSESCSSRGELQSCAAIDAFVNVAQAENIHVNVLGLASETLTFGQKCSSGIIYEQFGCLYLRYINDGKNFQKEYPVVYAVFKSLFGQEYILKTGVDGKKTIEILKS